MTSNPLPDALRSRWTLEGEIPLSGVAEGAQWRRARSLSTGRDVVLFIVQGEAAPEAADAVRRASLVEDPHLLPVQDIVVLDDPREETASDPTTEPAAVPAGGPTTVVEYPLPPAPPLAALLAQGPLHPETARAVIGEAATGLEAARRRGVRHQLLDSNRVFVDTRSGAVHVLGVGVEAASHLALDHSLDVASFHDTAALVALLYRALTGRSPRHDPAGEIPRPSAVVDTPIPEDLDLLCALVLNESAEELPETTRGLIEALEPWQSIPVTLEAYPRSGGAAAEASAASPGSEDELESTARMDAVPGTTEADPESTARMDAVPGTTEADPESTALREAVPGTTDDDAIAAPDSPAPDGEADRDVVEEPPAVAPSPVAGAEGAGAAGTPGAAGTGGLAGAVRLAGAAAAPGDTRAQEDEPEESGARDSDPQDEDAAAPEPREPGAPDRDADDRADPKQPRAQVAATAKSLVEELHLDQKRDTTAFPGHLEITLRQQPEPASASAGTPEGGAPAPGVGAAPAGGAIAAGVSAAGHEGTAATARGTADEDAPGTAHGAAQDVPGRTSGTHWPLADAQTPDRHPQPPLAPPPDPEGRVHRPAAIPADPSAATPDHSAPTPSAPVPPTASAPTGPVTGPVTAGRPDGPIVVPGRDRSLLEGMPTAAAGPSSRSSLLRDVVGVAVDADAPQTFTMGPRDRDKRSLQSQWIIIGGAIAVMIALVIALTSITRDTRGLLEDPLATAQPATSAAPTEEPTDDAPVEPTPTATEEPALPAPELAGIELFVQSEGQEPDHTDQQERLTDGDPSTFWSTQHYASPDYGGLKDGVGIRLDFAEPSTFTAVTVDTARNNGGILELRAVAEDGSLGDVLATGEFVADGQVRLEAPEELETDQVALWIPQLPPDSDQDGRFRARIAEIRVE